MASVRQVMNAADLLELRRQVESVYIHDIVYHYLLDLITATRNHAHLERGGSPRATIALVRMAKACAWLAGRSFVTPLDVAGQFRYCLSHRLTLNQSARMAGISRDDILTELLESVVRPDIGFNSLRAE